ncbi:MAG: aminoacyl-tRNA hydrolase [Bacteroidetes bacterium]|nr:aminoacyl-tRNA hydrolase [Bacteroidota bacterium]
MLIVTAEIRIPDTEIEERFVRSSGPGGQNVNKVATAVQLRFDVFRSPSLPDEVRSRLLRQAAARITDDGILLIEARRYRTQERNRQDARERLLKLVQKAALPPRPRKPTRPTRASNLKRLESKRRRGEIKKSRQERGAL